jgi:transposase InsO family protein
MLGLLLHSFRDLFRSRASLESEIVVLRHQVVVLRRRLGRRKLGLTGLNRALFVLASRVWSGWRSAVFIVQPATVLRWHRNGFRRYWRWKSRNRGGRPRIPTEVRQLIRQMHHENPLWGAPRIHGELLMLGIEIAESTVSNYLATLPGRRRSQRWRTFLRNHLHETIAIDFAVVPTIRFKLLYVFVVLDLSRRGILHIGVTRHPTAEWTGQRLLESLPWDSHQLRFLIRDRDGIYSREFRKRADSLDLTQMVTARASPWQNGYCERVIGTLRRECLDHVIAINERQLQHVLDSYVEYYNRTRTHLALAKGAPEGRRAANQAGGRVVSLRQVGGRHHRYERIAA